MEGTGTTEREAELQRSHGRLRGSSSDKSVSGIKVEMKTTVAQAFSRIRTLPASSPPLGFY